MGNNKPTTRKLKIAHRNANGLRNKLSEHEEFILQDDIDVILVNETKLTIKNNCKVPGYMHLRKEREQKGRSNPGGGVMILIKELIKCSELCRKL